MIIEAYAICCNFLKKKKNIFLVKMNMIVPRIEKPAFCICETKGATAQLISALVLPHRQYNPSSS